MITVKDSTAFSADLQVENANETQVSAALVSLMATDVVIEGAGNNDDGNVKVYKLVDYIRGELYEGAVTDYHDRNAEPPQRIYWNRTLNSDGERVPSGLVCLPIYNFPDADIDKVQAILAEDPYTFLCYKCSNQKGLNVVVPVDLSTGTGNAEADELNAIDQLQVYYGEKLGVVLTPVADTEGGTYVSYDSGIVVKDGFVPFKLDRSFASTRYSATGQANVLVSQDGAANFATTDTANAKRLARILEGTAKFVHDMGKDYVFDGVRWIPDDAMTVMHSSSKLSSMILKEVSTIPGDTASGVAKREAMTKFAQQSEDARRRRDAIALWRSEPGATVGVDTFDNDPWLLNCKNGTLDLRTATLREHKADDMLTTCTGVEYDPNATCERWVSFMHEIFQNDTELVSFMQRVFGYALTGDTSEQCIFVLYGNGSNGKSTMLSVVRDIMADLSKHAAIETFGERDKSHIPEDRARLRGARLVTAAESNKAFRLDEAFIKDGTGGEPVTARKLHANSFEYVPAYKLFLATNHKPTITGTDDGIWRRIRLIPFLRKFEGKDIDPTLSEVLKGEMMGILNWMVQGCLQWQERRLSPPAVVTDATNEYRSDSDTIGTFLKDNFIFGATLEETANNVYECYKVWAVANGYRVMAHKTLSQSLAERGLKKKKSGSSRGWYGLNLASSLYDPRK